MIQNIKVDTIYYLTNSDFEMEFNLCGCCKMRLLTDKADNPKNFVDLLARAVSRSQVIICCGKLFNTDGLLNLVSRAIKKPLRIIDNSKFSIADSNEIKIIDGSVPLVNSDGCFCGCIIESGPQSIILLTDNKSLRKTILKPLIHPYLEELSIIRNSRNTSVVGDSQKEPEITKNPSPVTPETDNETEDKEDDPITITKGNEAPMPLMDYGNQLSEVIMDDGFETSPQTFIDPSEINEGFDLYLEPERVKYSKNSHYTVNYIPSVRDNEFLSESMGDELSDGMNDVLYESSKSNTSSANKKLLSIPIIIVALILIIALVVLAYLLIFIPMKSDFVFSEYIKHIFTVSANFKPLL